MGSGGASWAVATWHVLVDGVNAHTWGDLWVSRWFSVPLGFLVFKTSLDTFSLFTETHLLFLRNYPPTHFDSSLVVAFSGGRCATALPNFPPFKVRFSPLLRFPFVSMPMRAMVSSILISSFSFFFFSFLFGFVGDLVCPSMVSSSEVRTECPSISFLVARLGGL